MASSIRSHLVMEAEDRIRWTVAHPGMSDWLKKALLTAADREPIDVLNDLEVLNVLLRQKSHAQIEANLDAFTPSIVSSDQTLLGLFQFSK